MANDTATTRLLYAILSQKCLKDIDWNKVARDPILSQEITNGHAVRMCYSRFKKQMEGTAPVRRPRNNNGSPLPLRNVKAEEDAAQSSQNTPPRSVVKREPSPDDEA